MSSRRGPSTTRLSPLQPGRRRRRSSWLGAAAVALGLIAIAGAALIWLVG